MYIPVSFFGGNNCTGSGFCYSYGNTSTSSADAITYTSLCGVPSYQLSISPNRVEKFAAISGSVSGLAATTKLVGQPYFATSSCKFVQPHIYTINYAGAGQDIYFYQPENDIPTREIVSTGTTRSITSMFPPQLIFRNSTGGNIPSTLTDNGFTSTPSLDTWNDGTIREYEFLMQSGSFSIYSVYGGKTYIRTINLPQLLDNSPGLFYPILSETTPFIENNIAFSNRDYFSILDINCNDVSYPVSDCWTYSITNGNISPSTTINYLTCNNQSASVVVANGASTTICAKYESIVLPSLAAGSNLTIDIITPCYNPLPLPSGSIPVSQSIWSAIDLAYSNYSTASYIISDLSGNNNYLSNSTSSWNLITTSSVSGSIFENTKLSPSGALRWPTGFPASSYSLLLAWKPITAPYQPYEFLPPLIANSDNSGNDHFGMFGSLDNNIYAGDSFQGDYEQCGTNGATLNNWHISQISVNNTTLSSSYCIDGITGSMGPTGLGETVDWRLFGGFINNREAWYTGSIQFQIAAIYSGSLSNDQMVTNWNALKGRYGY